MPSIKVREQQLQRAEWKRTAHDESLPAQERLAAISRLFEGKKTSTRYKSLVTRLTKAESKGKKFAPAPPQSLPPVNPAVSYWRDEAILAHPNLTHAESDKLDNLMLRAGYPIIRRPSPKPAAPESDPAMEAILNKLRAHEASQKTA
jgi:hypothetical protein